MNKIKLNGSERNPKNSQMNETVVNVSNSNLEKEEMMGLKSLDHQHYQVFKKIVEYYRDQWTDIDCLNESELWEIVGDINQNESIEFYLKTLEFKGLLMYESCIDENDIVFWDIGIQNIDKYIEEFKIRNKTNLNDSISTPNIDSLNNEVITIKTFFNNSVRTLKTIELEVDKKTMKNLIKKSPSLGSYHNGIYRDYKYKKIMNEYNKKRTLPEVIEQDILEYLACVDRIRAFVEDGDEENYIVHVHIDKWDNSPFIHYQHKMFSHQTEEKSMV